MTHPDVHYARGVDGAHIAYQAFGTGRYDILFVPGQLSHLDLAWEDPQEAAFLRTLATHGRVIVLDRRGVGLSDRLAPGEAAPAEVLVEDLAAVLAAAGASRPVLFGCAEGAQLAALHAATHPERIHGLVLYALWSHTPDATRSEYRDWIEWSSPRWGSLETALNDARDVNPSRAGDPDYLAWVARTQRGAVSPGSLAPLGEVDTALDVRDILPTIRVPTLALYRERDSAVPAALLRASAALIPGATVVELPGADHWWSSEPSAPLFDALGAYLAGLGGTPSRGTRRLTTTLFTDIAGSTERAAAIGDERWGSLLAAHHLAVREQLERYGGTEVDTAGDGFFATFDGPARAIRCGLAIIERVGSLGLRVRAGVHTGEVEVVDRKVAGLAVVIGARISALADPGTILVSSTVRDLVAGSGLALEDVGEQELKGVPGPWRLYRVAEGRRP